MSNYLIVFGGECTSLSWNNVERNVTAFNDFANDRRFIESSLGQELHRCVELVWADAKQQATASLGVK